MKLKSRVVRPELWQDIDLAGISDGAVIMFIGLMQLADRDGLLEDSPEVIRGMIRPFHPKHPTNQYLTELHGGGFIVRYEVEGKQYIWVKNLQKHQPIHKNESSYGIPLPDSILEEAKVIPVGKGKPPTSKGKGKGNSKDKGKSSSELLPRDLAEMFNETCTKYPRVLSLKTGSERYRKCLSRLAEHPGRDFWELIFRKTQRSELMGKWASFSWVVESENNLLKIYEGNYDKREGMSLRQENEHYERKRMENTNRSGGEAAPLKDIIAKVTDDT